MMKRIPLQCIFLVFTTLALFLPLEAEAQTVDWDARYNGPASIGDLPLEVRQAPEGDAYVTGTVYETMTGPPDTTAPRLFAARYDSDGNLLWDLVLSAEVAIAVDAAVDSAGNVLLAGTAIDQSLLVAKISPQGSLLWTYSFSGDPSLPNVVGTAVATDPSGNVYGLGHEFLGEEGHGLVVKLMPDGTLDWSISDDTLEDMGPGAAVADADALYFTGSQSVTAQGLDLLVARVLSDGTLDWSATYGSTLDEQGFDVGLDSTGAVVACGSLGSGNGDSDLGLVKLERDGTPVWQRSYDHGSELYEAGFGLDFDSENRIATAGLVEVGNNDSAGLLVVYQSDGTLAWVREVEEAGEGTFDRFDDVAIDADDRVYATGRLDPSDAETSLTVVRYGSEGGLDWSYVQPVEPGGGSAGVSAVIDANGRAIVTGNAYREGNGYDIFTLAFSEALFFDDFEDGTLDAWLVVEE